jgi:hypothetical protein
MTRRRRPVATRRAQPTGMWQNPLDDAPFTLPVVLEPPDAGLTGR